MRPTKLKKRFKKLFLSCHLQYNYKNKHFFELNLNTLKNMKQSKTENFYETNH